MKLLAKMRAVAMGFAEDVLSRVGRVEDLMASGMTEDEARRAVEVDWAKGVHRWAPINHDEATLRAKGIKTRRTKTKKANE